MQLEDALVPPGTVFVAHEEIKQSVGTKKVLKVFLVDSDGKKHLAATGEDLGDAHYHYRSSKPFSKYGVVDCHNRKELTIWLEMIIHETSSKEGPHLDADEANPEGVFFTAHKYERAHMFDGRRVNRWYLVDQHGSAHLAVIGVERDTKDGHYVYNAEEPFATRIPLQCSNQSGVFKWLEKWITHHAGGAHTALPTQAGGGNGQTAASGGTGTTAVSGNGASGTDSGTRKPPLFISLSAIRQARKSSTALLAAEAMVVDPASIPSPSPTPKPKPTPAAPLPPQPPAAAAPPPQPQAVLPAPRPPVPQLPAALPPLPPVMVTPAAFSSLHDWTPVGHATTGHTTKQKAVGIVQQNQIKKARKLQEDAKAEQERVVAGHLARLRRAAAAEVHGDSAAKQVTMSWLQGRLSDDELDALEHWMTLLRAVLDLQQQHQQWQQQQQQTAVAAAADGGGEAAPAGGQAGEQQQQDNAKPAEQQQDGAAGPAAAAAAGSGADQSQQQQQDGVAVQQTQQPQDPKAPQPPPTAGQQQPPQGPSPASNPGQQQPPPKQQQQQQQAKQKQQKSAAAATAADGGVADKDLMGWLRQPGNKQHHLRIMLECLKEIGAADLPARVLMGRKVIALVQRCLSEPTDEAVRDLAQHMLRRWNWQLAGHMQVLTSPTYMQDHLAVLDQEIAAGAVPLPQLPKHKQALINAQLPALTGAATGRMTYTQQHAAHGSSHHQQHHQQHHQLPPMPGSAPTGLQAHQAAAAAARAHASLAGSAASLASLGQSPAGLAGQHDGSLGLSAAGLGLLNPSQLGAAGFGTPLSALSGLYRSGSPALAAALGAQQSLLQAAAATSMGQPALLGQQQMSVFGCADPALSAAELYALNGSTTPGVLQWPFMSSPMPALPVVGQQLAVSSGMVPVHQQGFLLLQQQHQQHQAGLAAAAAAAAGAAAAAAAAAGAPGPASAQSLQQAALLQQPLSAGQLNAGLLAQQQLQQWQQQQQWLGLLQQQSVGQQQQNLQQQQQMWQAGGTN